MIKIEQTASGVSALVFITAAIIGVVIAPIFAPESLGWLKIQVVFAVLGLMSAAFYAVKYGEI